MRRTLAGAAVLSGVLLAALLGLTLWSLLTPAPSVRALPSLELTALGGGAQRLEDTGGAPTVVFLWTTDCAACGVELALLLQATRSARYGGFRYLFINQGNDAAAIRRHLELSDVAGAAPHIYLDPNSSAYDALAANGLPATYAFRDDGTLHRGPEVLRRVQSLEATFEPLLGDPKLGER